MVTVNIAYTEPINPSGASPVLTRDQIWKGLQRKIRQAQDFVPPITATDILEEKENEVVRVAHFKDFAGEPSHTVKETCKSFPPTKVRNHFTITLLLNYLRFQQVDFWQPNGALITNTISEGPGLTENDLHMTYAFEWRYPDVVEGSEEHKNNVKTLTAGAKMAVHSSIEAMRKMAEAGELD